MKKTFIYIVAAVFALAPSCAGFLDENPSTMVSDKAAYASERALEVEVMGCLNAFYGSGMYMGDMNEIIHTGSGLMVWKGAREGKTAVLSGLYFAKLADNETVAQCYSQHYSAIGRCNRLIENLPDSPVDEAYKAEIEGEARFYRAVLYFTLVRLFGPVPLVLDVPDGVSDVNRPRVAYEKVYAQILEDLDFAEKNMRDAARVAETGYTNRVNKWAATSYKSAVYAYIASILDHQEDNFFKTAAEGGSDPDFSLCGISDRTQAWTCCLESADSVIVNGPYRLCPNFGQLFRWTEAEDWTLPERIFCLASNNKIQFTNYLAARSLMLGPEGTQDTNPSNKNSGRFRPSRFLFQTWCELNGGKKGTAGDRDENIYVSTPDPRLKFSLFHTSYYSVSDQTDVKIYPDEGSIFTSSSSKALPYYRKYCDPTYASNNGCADMYMMRLAEVYLYAAEACAELSLGDEGSPYWTRAFEYVEAVHKRARQSLSDRVSVAPDPGLEAKYPKWNPDDYVGTEELTTAIFWEKMFELCGEGHEWFETHRHGAKWLSRVIARPYNFHQQEEENAALFESSYHSTLAPEDVESLRKSLMCAFPQEEINYNNAISSSDQNDFYWNNISVL